MAAPESVSVASRATGISAIIIQQITCRSIDTPIHKLFAVMLACRLSTVNCFRWLPRPSPSLGHLGWAARKRSSKIVAKLRRFAPLGGRRRPPLRGSSAAPAVDEFPPDQPRPLVEVDLRPLAMPPPLHSKLAGIEGCRNAVVCRQLVLKDAEGPPSVKIRSHQQNSSSVASWQTASHISSFTFG